MPRLVLQIDKAEVRFGAPPAPGDAIDPTSLTDFACQVTRAEITSTSNTTTTPTPATFCEAAAEATVPVASSFILNLDWLQDWTLAQASGLSAFTFRNDATKQAFALYLAGNTDPEATGIVTVVAGGFGGTPGQPLVASVQMQVDGYPAITDGNGVLIRPASGTVAITGVTAGTPGAFVPANATPPATLAALKADAVVGDAGSNAPATAWTAGQYVLLGDASHAHWDNTGTEWLTGDAA